MTDGWQIAKTPENEAARLMALQRYMVMDTLPEEAFDRITRLASHILKTPIALVSLVDGDRQWFKSHHGIDATQTPRDMAFCAHAILQQDVLIVPDATKDERFRANPLVVSDPKVCFYAGAPLTTPDGFNIGTLCVIDREPHDSLSAENKLILQDLAALVIDELEFRSASKRAFQANQTKTKFIANMSHEIRTPMNVIMGFANMLADSKLDVVQKEHVINIQKSSEALLDIINDILDISKIEAGKMELENISFNLRQLIDDIVSLFSPKAAEKFLLLLSEFSANFPTQFIGDPSRLRQILINLVSNAIKFTEEGHVKISAHFDAKDGLLRLAVEDTGTGIKQENISKIFEDFSQEDMSTSRQYGGTGLGLAISRRLLEMMGGELKVTSEIGKGSKFAFALKLPVDSAETKATPINTPAQNATITAKILVVDDTEFNLQVARHILEKIGCTVTTAQSGQEAIDILAKKYFDIVFMDVQMPDMDGRETTRRIRHRERTKEKKQLIIAMTASALNEDKAACLECGMDDFISKPIQLNALREIIYKYTNKKIAC